MKVLGLLVPSRSGAPSETDQRASVDACARERSWEVVDWRESTGKEARDAAMAAVARGDFDVLVCALAEALWASPAESLDVVARADERSRIVVTEIGLDTGSEEGRRLADFVRSVDFLWHQRFELAPGIWAPGVNDIPWLLSQSQIPADLTGHTVLDIGATNGASAFSLERRGAARVVAVDVVDDRHFGFAKIRAQLRSDVEFVQCNVYELAEIFDEPFDVVVFWGVLYHLRHPLLGLDNVRAVAKDFVTVETAVADHELGDLAGMPFARFYRRAELGEDPSNWFAPSVAALVDWLGSSGLAVERVHSWPAVRPARALADARVVAGPPEFEVIGPEARVRTRSDLSRNYI